MPPNLPKSEKSREANGTMKIQLQYNDEQNKESKGSSLLFLVLFIIVLRLQMVDDTAAEYRRRRYKQSESSHVHSFICSIFHFRSCVKHKDEVT